MRTDTTEDDKMKKLASLLLIALVCAFSLTALAQPYAEESFGLKMEVPDGLEMRTVPYTAVYGLGYTDFIADGKVVAELVALKDSICATVYSNLTPLLQDPDGVHHNGFTYVVIADVDNEDDTSAYVAAIDEALRAGEFAKPARSLPENALVFSTLNVDGETVTQDIFRGKKVTMINCWETTCGFCINEMPELAEMEKELPEDAQILYLCCDVDSLENRRFDTAKTVVEKSGINRKNALLAAPGTFIELRSQAIGMPTTFFVDGDGVLYQELVYGANMEAYRSMMDELLKR